MEIETLDWLRTTEGGRLLVHAAQAWADHAGDPVRVAALVRRFEPDAEKAAAATTQAQLRAKAVAKFGDAAHQMFFTPDALEQATRTRVADHRAARLAAAVPGGSVVDLGCGIGGDLIAFARAGLVAAGVDLDPVRVAMARANLDALGLPGAVQAGDATAVDPSGFDAAFADPARRGGRGRVFDVAGWTPPWPWVLDLLQRRALVKVAPGIGHDLVPPGAEAEWVSDGGEVKEAVIWSPDLSTADRRATVIGERGLATLTDEDDPGAGVREVGAFLYEPDGAVVRAGLVTAVAAGVDGGLVDEHIAYVTSDASFRTPFARGYRVLEQLPYREKQLRAALQERGIGRLTIKKRGVQVVPEELRKRLALRGDDEATLVLTRVAGQGTALLVEPF
ncbi:class I SAM-dependent methyltransferase [Nocardioides eburneiflavus]|uniref:Class I SAM-dependent methyltransferase n=1 Tax=Nocardioides eburneiflavus TaxID=2518372 RepID=A0A4Z1C2E9_9ACTN|nr:class I SAM-dependent methyltransferase [Nocardioides eburneiflavus]TGN64404.1 class I SAM-dependent methyltransferase [Nocardioides eburneiflavus]